MKEKYNHFWKEIYTDKDGEARIRFQRFMKEVAIMTALLIITFALAYL